jgi:ribose 5-phosphate isomerase B
MKIKDLAAESAATGDGGRMKWAFGFDHAGFPLAQQLASYLTQHGHSVTCYGPLTAKYPVDYGPFCIAAAEAVAGGQADAAVVIGGSGQGEQIAANKVKGARAALCVDAHYTKLARRDNDANVMALPGRLMAREYAEELLEIWIGTAFEGGRHARRIGHIAQYERGEFNLDLPAASTFRSE